MEIFVRQGAEVMATLAPLLRQKLVLLVRLERCKRSPAGIRPSFEEELFVRKDFFQRSFDRAPDQNLGFDSHDPTRGIDLHNKNFEYR